MVYIGNKLMKYVYLLLLILVAGGGYKYYEYMQKTHVETLARDKEEFIAALSDMMDRNEALAADYDKTKEELQKVESSYDTGMQALRDNAKQDLDKMFKPRDAKELPRDAREEDRVRVNNLYRQTEKIQNELWAAEKRQIQLEKELKTRIQQNIANTREKERQVQQKYDDAVRKSSSNKIKGVSRIAAQRDKMEEWLEDLHQSSQQANSAMSDQLDASRAKYEKLALDSYKRIEKINEEIDKLILRIQKRKPAVGPEESKSDAYIGKLEVQLRDNRNKYTQDAKALRSDLLRKEREFRGTLKKAEKLVQSYDEGVIATQERHEQLLVYVKIIVGVLSAVFALATVFVFIGSRKVPEKPKSAY